MAMLRGLYLFWGGVICLLFWGPHLEMLRTYFRFCTQELLLLDKRGYRAKPRRLCRLYPKWGGGQGGLLLPHPTPQSPVEALNFPSETDFAQKWVHWKDYCPPDPGTMEAWHWTVELDCILSGSWCCFWWTVRIRVFSFNCLFLKFWFLTFACWDYDQVFKYRRHFKCPRETWVWGRHLEESV